MHLTLADADSVIKWSVGGAKSKIDTKRKRGTCRQWHEQYRCLLLGGDALLSLSGFHLMSLGCINNTEQWTNMAEQHLGKVRVKETRCNHLQSSTGRWRPTPWGLLPWISPTSSYVTYTHRCLCIPEPWDNAPSLLWVLWDRRHPGGHCQCPGHTEVTGSAGVGLWVGCLSPE